MDDAVVEAIGVGATGWIAGLANALPRESVDLFNWAINGESDKAFELYRWFLPLLRMDTVPNFVQLIKLVQQRSGWAIPVCVRHASNLWETSWSRQAESSMTHCAHGRRL